MSNFDTYSGVITATSGAASIVTADCQNNSGVYIWVQGTHAGITLAFEGTADGGATWQAVSAYPLNTTGNASNTVAVATNGFSHYYAMVGAAKQFRVRASAYTSGSLQVNLCAVTDADPVLSPTVTSATPAALTDGLANPTVGQFGTDTLLYNGGSWDRARGNWYTAVDASAARTTSGNSATFTNFNGAGATFSVNVTAASGTTPTLVWRPQFSYDGGTTFVDIDATNLSTASITTTGLFHLKIYPAIATAANASLNGVLPRFWRSAWTIGGTTPSFTFASYASLNN